MILFQDFWSGFQLNKRIFSFDETKNFHLPDLHFARLRSPTWPHVQVHIFVTFFSFFYKAMLVKNKHSSVEAGMGHGHRKCKKKICREQLSLRPQLSWRRHVPVIFMAWEKKPWSFNICTPKVFAVSWLHYFHVSSFKMLCTEKVRKRWGYRLVHLSWKTMHFSSCLDKLAEHSKYRQVQPFVLISLHSSWKSFKKSH